MIGFVNLLGMINANGLFWAELANVFLIVECSHDMFIVMNGIGLS